MFSPATFGLKGQVYDGWETRRRREPGHDHAIVRLGVPGIIRGIVVDTSFFTGNYPPGVSVEATGVEGYPSPDELAGAGWTTLVPRSPAKGDTRNLFEVADGHRYTHVRLCIYPDGGVARLRVHGEVVPDPRFLAGIFDLAAAENGGMITGCSDMFYSSAAHLIAPGRARTMGEGWENARRRDGGNDWVSLRLALPGRIRYAELDTSLFVGNAPGWARLSGSFYRDGHDPGAASVGGTGSGAASGASGVAIGVSRASGASGASEASEGSKASRASAIPTDSDISASSGISDISASPTGPDISTSSGISAGSWFELLPQTRLQPDTRHRFRLAGDLPVAAVRLDVYPDGGMARLRSWGEADPVAHQDAAARWLDALPAPQAADVLTAAGLTTARAADVAAASGRWALLPPAARAALLR